MSGLVRLRQHITNFLFPLLLSSLMFFFCPISLSRVSADAPYPLMDDSLNIAELRKMIERDIDSARIMADFFEAEAIKNNDPIGLARVYSIQSNICYLTGDYTKGILYAGNAADLYRQLNLENEYNQSLIMLGALNIHRGNWLLANDYLIRAARYFEEESDSLQMLRAYINLSGNHIILENYEIAQRYVERSLDMAEKTGSGFAYVKALNNQGILLFRRNRLHEARETFIRALVMAAAENEAQSYMDCLNHLGLIELQQDNYDKALEYYLQLVNYSGNYVDRFILSDGLINKGKVYEAMNNLPKAVESTERSIEISTLSGDHNSLMNAFRQMAAYKNKMNLPDEAFEYMEKYLAINDSLVNASRHRSILEIEAIYEAEKLEQQIRTLELENLLRQEKIKTITRINLLALSLLLISGLIVYLLIRIRQRKNQLIRMELEQSLLRIQMNPHFIFNSLVSVQSYILKADTLVAATFLSRLTKLMRQILVNSREKFIPLEKELELIGNYLELQSLRHSGSFSYKIDVSGDLAKEDTLIPPMLTQPFIENAIEHGFRNSNRDHLLNIGFSSTDNGKLLVVVEDNGAGRSKTSGENDNGHKSLATGITRNRIHLLNLMGYHEASVAIEDKTDSEGNATGTKVIFNLPLTCKSN